MQASCINYCATLPAIEFASIGWDDDMAGFWGNRYLREWSEE